jgi:hypothetical protein
MPESTNSTLAIVLEGFIDRGLAATYDLGSKGNEEVL